MAINNLRDIRNNVIQYVNNVPIEISAPAPITGALINPGEDFNFTIDVRNQALGVQLTGVRLRVQSSCSMIAQLRVPDFQPGFGGPTPFTGSVITNLSGAAFLPSQIGSLIREFIINFPASHSWYRLGPGENVPALPFRGSALDNRIVDIEARIIANIDLDWLFPQNQDSDVESRRIEVHPNILP